MQAYNASMADFLGAKKAFFVVPVYQRNYDWLDSNCRQLFFDIEKTIETGEEHFIGTVVFKASTSHERSLIDGQQRITSCTRCDRRWKAERRNRRNIYIQYRERHHRQKQSQAAPQQTG